MPRQVATAVGVCLALDYVGVPLGGQRRTRRAQAASHPRRGWAQHAVIADFFVLLVYVCGHLTPWIWSIINNDVTNPQVLRPASDLGSSRAKRGATSTA